jgi:hypothetical protein
MLHPKFVIPVKAGTQLAANEAVSKLDSRLRGNDGEKGYFKPFRACGI